MSNQYFQFKQFRVEQEHCAMKVTTDACIQGAWTPIPPGAAHILDIGTGTGLLSLMLAQRAGGAGIDAIEYDAAAAQQAKENVVASPWKNRISVLAADARHHNAGNKYDLVIANPPFFNNSLLGNRESRNTARHTISLSYTELLHIINTNLAATGHASVLLPYEGYLHWTKQLPEAGLFETRRLLVRHTPQAEVKRVVCLVSKTMAGAIADETLVIRNNSNEYTPEFKELLGPFYLEL